LAFSISCNVMPSFTNRGVIPSCALTPIPWHSRRTLLYLLLFT
jgi:hypothetical protein